jgi:S1-C subfamily serine protease
MLTPRARSLRWTVFLAPLLFARCASVATPAFTSADVRPIEQKEPISAGDAAARPIEFRKLLLRLPHDHVIGAIESGRGCAGIGPLSWKPGKESAAGDEFAPLLMDELTSAGYTLAGASNPDVIFDDPRDRRPEFAIAGIVREVRANVCYAEPRKNAATARASLTVEWQIYSYRTRSVELKATTDGGGLVDAAQESAGAEAISRAFVSAARNLLADGHFHDLIAGAGPGAPKTSSPPITVAWERRPQRREPDFESVVSDSRMSVVTVFAGDAMGSGFVISRDGYLLTDEHVVGSVRSVRVKFVTGREVDGEVVRVDRRRDVALIKLENDVYPYLPLGESSRVRPGSDVFAIGTPLAESFGQTVTKGVVSGFGEEDGLRILRSDVSVHRGNSGGPLLDGSGVVVGLSVSGYMLMPEGVGVGLNAFIPIEEALDALAIERQKK